MKQKYNVAQNRNTQVKNLKIALKHSAGVNIFSTTSDQMMLICCTEAHLSQIPAHKLWLNPYVPDLSVCMFSFGATDEQWVSKINLLVYWTAAPWDNDGGYLNNVILCNDKISWEKLLWSPLQKHLRIITAASDKTLSSCFLCDLVQLLFLKSWEEPSEVFQCGECTQTIFMQLNSPKL